MCTWRKGYWTRFSKFHIFRESFLIVCIAEKPSVAKEIARILGARARKDGYFEGAGYVVTWTFGHLCELEDPAFYNGSWKHWNISTLPLFPDKFETRLIEDKGVIKQFQIIQKLLKKCDKVINCGDAGQEGELIQRWVLKKADYTEPHQRLWISSLTDEAIRKGFQKLRPSQEFDNLYHAGLVRAIGDWLLGINATRAYTLKFSKGEGVLSVGRVQTPTLAMIVERHHTIQNFKPEPYWNLNTFYKEVKFSHFKNPFKDQSKGKQTLSLVQGQPFHIISTEGKELKIPPQRLFDLTTLQVECNKRFGFSADKTLKAAQQLYEKKVISYPRVDTQYLSEDVFKQIHGIIQSLGKNSNYNPFTKQIPDRPKKSKRYFNDNKVTDHHAIIPTNQSVSQLAPDLFRIYDLIVRRFLAIFYPDSIEFKTTVKGESNQQQFVAKGTQLLHPGWQSVYPTLIKIKQEEEQKMPAFVQGESGPHTPELEQKETKPPKKYTEATLLRAMESCGKSIEDSELKDALKANGIGRPSTRASILETLFRREYIVREKKNLIPTQKGIDLIAAIRNETLKSPILTGDWEKKLRQIEAGTYKAGLFLNELNQYVASIIQEVKQVPGQPTTQKGLAPCPKCKVGQIIDGSKAYGCSEWRKGCDFKVWKEICKKKVSATQVKKLLTTGSTQQLKGFVSKQGKKFNASLVLAEDFSIQMKFSS